MAQGGSFRLSHLAAMLALWGGLLGWSWSAPRVGCLVGALVLAPLWLVLTVATSELALLRRATFVRQYLEPRGRLARWLGRRLWLLTWQATKALVLALALLVGALSLQAVQWLVLAVDILLLATLLFFADWMLEGELKPRYEAVLVRHWAHRLNALLLWVALSAVLFYAAHEDYQGMGPAAVVRLSALGVAVGCDALALLARLAAVSEGLLWWAAENLFGGLTDPTERVVAWAGFVGAFGVSFLLAWAYSRALVGILARPWKGLGELPKDA